MSDQPESAEPPPTGEERATRPDAPPADSDLSTDSTATGDQTSQFTAPAEGAADAASREDRGTLEGHGFCAEEPTGSVSGEAARVAANVAEALSSSNHGSDAPSGPTVAEGLEALPPSPGETPAAVAEAFDKVEAAAAVHAVAAVNEFGDLVTALTHAKFDDFGAGEGESWEENAAASLGSEGHGTSFGAEAAEAGAAIAGELDEAVLEMLSEAELAVGDFAGGVISGVGDHIENTAAALEAIGRGEIGEAASLLGEGMVDVLDDVADIGLAGIKGGIGVVGEGLEGAGAVAREVLEGADEVVAGAANEVSDWASDLADDVFSRVW